MAVVGALLVMFSLPGLAHAEEPECGNEQTIKGTVLGTSGHPVIGAQVALEVESLEDVQVTQSDEGGRFLFSDLGCGLYTVTVFKSGFKTVSYPGLPIIRGRVLRLPIELSGPGESLQPDLYAQALLDRIPIIYDYYSIFPAVADLNFDWLPDVTIDNQRTFTGEVLSRDEQARIVAAPTLADRLQIIPGATVSSGGQLAFQDAPPSETRVTMDGQWIPGVQVYALSPKGPARVVDGVPAARH